MAKNAKKSKKNPPSAPQKTKQRSLTGFFLKAAGAICFLIFGGLAWCFLTLPDLNTDAKGFRSAEITLLDKDGYELFPEDKKFAPPVDLKELPVYVPQAFLVTEDARFFEHAGIDPVGILRALKTNLFAGRKAQGGSTITQQVVKNLFLTREKSFKRKIQEIMLAFLLERRLTKEQILTVYLNRVYFGAGAYGIENAARRYFGKTAAKLTPYDAAALAALMKAPTTYNPATHPEKSTERTRLILKKMVKAGVLSAKEAENARPSPLTKGKNKNFARYYKDWVLRELDDYVGGLTEDVIVFTTLDATLQEKTEAAVAAVMPEAEKKHVSQTAVVVMDKTGGVLAMVGGKDYAESQFNRATDAFRQAGSTVKPFVYLAAFENGSSPTDEETDEKIDINGFSPKNASGKYAGKMTLADALIRSVNTIAVKTAVKTGIDKTVKTAQKFGAASSACKREAAIALGVCAVRPIDLTAAYAALANGGRGVIPHAVLEVRNKNDDVLYSRKTGGRPKLAKAPALKILDGLLARVVTEGTGKNAALPSATVKGKTGTTQNYRDAWFVGYTDDIVAGVWMGNDDDSPTDKVAGGGLPAQLWRDIVRNASF